MPVDGLKGLARPYHAKSLSRHLAPKLAQPGGVKLAKPTPWASSLVRKRKVMERSTLSHPKLDESSVCPARGM